MESSFKRKEKKEFYLRLRKYMIRIFISMILGYCLAIIIHSYIIFPLRIENLYMYPEFNKENISYIVTYFNNEKLNYGNIILFKSKYDKNQIILSRIIGLPKDRIQIKNKKVYKNGVLYKEKYNILFNDKRSPFLANFSNRDNMNEIIIPQNQFFVLGDNRDEALDSRELGLVPKANIIGKALFH